MMRPLEGLTILDLSRMLPVGVLSQSLADLGARIIKVERPGTGEETRAFGARLSNGMSAPHAFIDRGKESIALDLKHPHGLAVVRELATRSDAVLESFRPSVADRLGVGYDQLREVNDRLVYCTVNGYGTGGPRDAAAGHDLNYLAYSGVLHFSGTHDHGPQLSGTQIADVIGGLQGAVGLLAALWSVKNGGPGTRVEVGLADAALWAIGLHVSSWLADGKAGERESIVVGGSAPCYRIYRCQDGRYLSVGAIEPEFWAEFVNAVQRPDLLSRQYDASAIEDVAELIASREMRHWVELLDGLQTCVAPVQDFSEVLADEQFAARGMIVPVPGLNDAQQVATPIRMSEPLAPVRSASPSVGGDSERILAELDLPSDVNDSVLAWAALDPKKKES